MTILASRAVKRRGLTNMGRWICSLFLLLFHLESSGRVVPLKVNPIGPSTLRERDDLFTWVVGVRERITARCISKILRDQCSGLSNSTCVYRTPDSFNGLSCNFLRASDSQNRSCDEEEHCQVFHSLYLPIANVSVHARLQAVACNGLFDPISEASFMVQPSRLPAEQFPPIWKYVRCRCKPSWVRACGLQPDTPWSSRGLRAVAYAGPPRQMTAWR